jgi:hypothetical protein
MTAAERRCTFDWNGVYQSSASVLGGSDLDDQLIAY